jgi:uncharacterized GH25 family protein
MEKKMNRWLLAPAVLAATFALSAPAGAHRQWMLPSTTALSGTDGWVTVDAAISTDPYVADHNPMKLDGIAVTAPDGSAGAIENGSSGKFRSTFDVHLTKPGTWKIAGGMQAVMASWTADGQPKRWRGSAEEFAKAVPADAPDLKVSEMQSRNELFVTLGAPDTAVLKPAGKGLEFAPVSHPDDLVADEPATFGFLVDGQPAAGVQVTLIPGGRRFRDQANEIPFSTDAKGRISVKWPAPGVYWLQATLTDAKTSVPQAKERRLSYTTTIEVMAP